MNAALAREGTTDPSLAMQDTTPRTGNNFGIRTGLNAIGTAGNNAGGV